MQMYVVQAQQLNPYIYVFNFGKCKFEIKLCVNYSSYTVLIGSVYLIS